MPRSKQRSAKSGAALTEDAPTITTQQPQSQSFQPATWAIATVEHFISILDASAHEPSDFKLELIDIFSDDGKRSHLLQAWKEWRGCSDNWPVISRIAQEPKKLNSKVLRITNVDGKSEMSTERRLQPQSSRPWGTVPQQKTVSTKNDTSIYKRSWLSGSTPPVITLPTPPRSSSTTVFPTLETQENTKSRNWYKSFANQRGNMKGSNSVWKNGPPSSPSGCSSEEEGSDSYMQNECITQATEKAKNGQRNKKRVMIAWT